MVGPKKKLWGITVENIKNKNYNIDWCRDGWIDDDRRIGGNNFTYLFAKEIFEKMSKIYLKSEFKYTLMPFNKDKFK